MAWPSVFSPRALCSWNWHAVAWRWAANAGTRPRSTPSAAVYPAVKLRGYGVVAGTFTETKINGRSAGVLRIVCQNEDKAKLVQAKYLSDLQLLPGVGKTNGQALRSTRSRTRGSSWRPAPGRRSGSWPRPPARGCEDWSNRTCQPVGSPLISTPEVPVPMYLDRWDKYGFRFYYGPFVKPQDAEHREVATYDPRQDFAFAKQSGDVGLVVWNTPFGMPLADGILDFNSRDWVFKAAQQAQIADGREPRPGGQQSLPGQPLSQRHDAQRGAVPGRVVRRDQFRLRHHRGLEFRRRAGRGPGATRTAGPPPQRRRHRGQLARTARRNVPRRVRRAGRPWAPRAAEFLPLSPDQVQDARRGGRALATAGGLQDLGRRALSRIRHLPGLERDGDRSDGRLEDQLRRALQRPVRPARPGRFGLGRHPRAGPRHRAGPAPQTGRVPPARQARSGLAGGASAGLALSARSERHPRRLADEPRPGVRQRQGDPGKSPLPRRIALGHAGRDFRADRRRQPAGGLPAAGPVHLSRLSVRRSARTSIRRWARGSTPCGPTSRTGPRGPAGRRSAAARR